MADGNGVALHVRERIKGISLSWIDWCRKEKEESEILKLLPDFFVLRGCESQNI